MQTKTDQPASLAELAAVLDLTDSDITDMAERAAKSVQRLAKVWGVHGTPDDTAQQALRRIAKHYRVMVPSKDGHQRWLNRMSDAGWWRRALRQRLRVVELNEIRRGAVHRAAVPYVSGKALRRFERNARRLSELLATLEAVNQATGEVLPLAELIEASRANPSNRRKAMMAQIRGVEAYAKTLGHEAYFLTITCPSRMHARHHTGQANAAYDCTSPRGAQAYLGRLWNTALRHLAHQGVKPFGLRVVEPHHDACPHWHVLAFVAAEHAQVMASALRAYALADTPQEPGAQERRFTVERIDPAKGSAVGYIAKYVSKSIDGHAVDGDEESDSSGADAARRIVAWARTWGIRQFQFFGLSPITPIRELYRLDAQALPGEAMHQAHEACKANDYGAWLRVCEAHALRFKVAYSERPSTRYRDEQTKAIHGLRVTGGDVGGCLELVTRAEAWRIQPRQKERQGQGDGDGRCPAPASPWTRFNNSAPLDFKGLFEGEEIEASMKDRRRRTGHGIGPRKPRSTARQQPENRAAQEAGGGL